MGGLAAFVRRMSEALAALGHSVDVFAMSEENRVIEVGDVRVEEIAPTAAPWLAKLRRLLPKRRRGNLGWLLHLLRGSITIARIFARHHKEIPYDIVHTSDYGFTGLFVPRDRRLVHVVRSSHAADLFEGLDGHDAWHNRLAAMLERRIIRRADRAYAPSRFVADYFRREHGLDVRTLYPPFHAGEAQGLPAALAGLPEKYLIYFGVVTPRKGTDVLAQALPVVWDAIPSFTMVWAGVELIEGELDRYRSTWGDQSARVIWLGRLPRTTLHSIVRRAVATLVPSRADNLPNSAIESLSLGVPVIGSRGASVDEIVDERCGELVRIGDVQGLAAAMMRAWNGTSAWHQLGFSPPQIFREMAPDRAANALVNLAVRNGSAGR